MISHAIAISRTLNESINGLSRRRTAKAGNCLGRGVPPRLSSGSRKRHFLVVYAAGAAGAVFVTGALLILALLTAAFVRACVDFFAAGACAFAAAARFNAQRRLLASLIARRPAADNFRFGFGTPADAGVGGSDWPLILAHLLSWPARIRCKASALSFRFRCGPAWEPSDVLRPGTRARSSAICWSILTFCDSKPSMAASITLSFSCGI